MECDQVLREKFGMCFTGTVKTNSRGYPMKTLNAVILNEPGDNVSMKWESGNGDTYLATATKDRTRRTFISTHGTTNSGKPQTRRSWRNNADLSSDRYGMELHEITIDHVEVVS